MAFADTLRVLNTMKAEGVVEEYAIAGAMAIVFWTEPVPTFDLDVLVVPSSPDGALVSLDGIYRWTESRGYPAEEEHIIEGLPTQFVPSPGPLARKAIASAVEADYQGVVVRVVRPEYLIALYLQPGARTAKRRERAAMLMELSSAVVRSAPGSAPGRSSRSSPIKRWPHSFPEPAAHSPERPSIP